MQILLSFIALLLLVACNEKTEVKDNESSTPNDIQNSIAKSADEGTAKHDGGGMDKNQKDLSTFMMVGGSKYIGSEMKAIFDNTNITLTVKYYENGNLNEQPFSVIFDNLPLEEASYDLTKPTGIDVTTADAFLGSAESGSLHITSVRNGIIIGKLKNVIFQSIITDDKLEADSILFSYKFQD
jgi:hypothetical protein